MLVYATLCGGQDATPENSVVARLDGAITPSGILQVDMTVTAAGAPSSPYRGDLMRTAGAASPSLFGAFLRGRHLPPVAQVTDADQPDRPVQIRFRFQEEDFLLPIQREQSLALDLIPMSSSLAAAPALFREEISLAIPQNFTARGSNVNSDSGFARYRSVAKMDGQRLIVARELLINPRPDGAVSPAEMNSFWKVVREDQQKQFILRRISRSDRSQWIQSVSLEQAKRYGSIAYQQREYEAARQLFSRAVRLQPKDPSAWNNLGRALAQLGELDEAQKAYETEISINPRSQASYNNLGLVQERQGHWDAAVASLIKQIEVHPGDSYAISNLPLALIHAGRWPEAEAAASRALDARPDNAGFFLTECGKENELAESYVRGALDQMKSQEVPAGVRGMSSAISFQSSYSTYLDTYGWLLFKQGGNDRAIAALTAAVTLGPRAEIYAHLAQAEFKAGLEKQAILHWREATFLEPGQISTVPAEIAPQVKSLAPVSLDQVWFPLPANFSAQIADKLPTGQPSYFFVTTNANGVVDSARELTNDDDAAPILLPAVRAISFPVVEADGVRLSTVNLVKVLKDSAGQVIAARSVAPGAVAIATDLAPGEFPLPAVASAGANKLPEGITKPRLLQKVEPQYSEEARKARLVGTVVLQIVIGMDGKTSNIKVIRSLGLGLDEEAIRSVKDWQFAPAEKDGTAVAVSSTIEVNFRLLNDRSSRTQWYLGRVEFDFPPDATRPIFLQGGQPKESASAGKATATVTFEINEGGAPSHPVIQKASDEDWAKDVLAMAGKMKFRPALQNGVPVPATCTMDFVRGN